MKRDNKWIKITLPLIFIIIIIALILIISIGKPTKEVITNILVDNGVRINGSDSNIIDPQSNHPPHHVVVGFRKEDITRLEIIESGYDFINRKYFCIFEFNAYGRDQYSITAKALMLLHYDKGWEVSDSIGVFYANYELDE